MRTVKTPSFSKVNAAVGARLESIRESLGLTRMDVANALGCDYRRVFRMEMGESGVRLNDLPALAKVYSLDAGELARDLILLAADV